MTEKNKKSIPEKVCFEKKTRSVVGFVGFDLFDDVFLRDQNDSDTDKVYENEREATDQRYRIFCDIGDFRDVDDIEDRYQRIENEEQRVQQYSFFDKEPAHDEYDYTEDDGRCRGDINGEGKVEVFCKNLDNASDRTRDYGYENVYRN